MIKTTFTYQDVEIHAKAKWVSPYTAIDLKLKSDGMIRFNKREIEEIEELAIELLYEESTNQELEF